MAEARGLRLVGSDEHALLPHTGLDPWALQGWDHWHGFLVVPPPREVLRT